MRYLIVIFATLLILSCSKNDPPNSTGTPNASPALLKKFYVLDTTYPSPYDTFFMRTFDYDNRNRIVNLTHFFCLGGQFIKRDEYTFTYSGIDTLANTAFKESKWGNIHATSLHFFEYDIRGNMLSDSIIEIGTDNSQGTTNTNRLIKKYQTDATGYIEKIYYHFPRVDSFIKPHYRVIRDARGNVIEAGDGIFLWNYIFQYENKINPLYKTFPVRPPYNRSNEFPSYFEDELLPQPNTFSKIFVNKFDASGQTIPTGLDWEMIHTYNAAGNVVSSRSRLMMYRYKYVYIY